MQKVMPHRRTMQLSREWCHTGTWCKWAGSDAAQAHNAAEQGVMLRRHMMQLSREWCRTGAWCSWAA